MTRGILSKRTVSKDPEPNVGKGRPGDTVDFATMRRDAYKRLLPMETDP